MRKDTHSAALLAASRVAFSVALLGCGGGTVEPANATDTTNPDDGNASGSTSESDLRGKHHPKPSSSSTYGRDAGSAPTDCDALIAEAFPTPSDYPGKKEPVSDAVVACCAAAIQVGNSAGRHHWDCCANLDPSDKEGILACTPWGPAVPPAMRAA